MNYPGPTRQYLAAVDPFLEVHSIFEVLRQEVFLEEQIGGRHIEGLIFRATVAALSLSAELTFPSIQDVSLRRVPV